MRNDRNMRLTCNFSECNAAVELLYHGSLSTAFISLGHCGSGRSMYIYWAIIAPVHAIGQVKQAIVNLLGQPGTPDDTTDAVMGDPVSQGLL